MIPLLIQGPTIQTILREAEKLKVDFIVTGSHGHRPMLHLIMGSISKGLVKHSHIPVLIVPSKELKQQKRKRKPLDDIPLVEHRVRIP